MTVPTGPQATAKAPIFSGAAILVVLINVILQPPWQVGMPSSSLDPSWAMVLLHAFDHGWQFGKDLIFTYGPLGFIMVPQYHPGLYWVSLAYWLLFHGALALGYCLLYRGANASALALLLLASLVATYSWAHDGALFAACVIMFLLARRDERAATSVAALLTVLLAAASLMKTTSLLLALPTAVLVDLLRAASVRKAPLFTPLFAAAFLALYLAAGQSLGGLGTYLFTALEVSRGYGEAMHVYGPMSELAVFLTASVALFGAVILSDSRRPLRETLFAAAMVAGFLFVTAKSGFVRHDLGHLMIPWSGLLLAAIAYLPESRRSTGSRYILAGTILVSAAAICMVYVGGAREVGRSEAAAHILASDLAAQLRDKPKTMAGVIAGDQIAAFEAAYRAEMANLRAASPAPNATGTIDIFGVNQALVLGGDAEYRPRPIFQGYSVYTPDLIARNRAALTGPRAPETILFEIDTVDGRYPSLDEGALWPDLLRLYDITGYERGYATLKRRTIPRDVTLTDLAEKTIGFAEDVDVSAWADGLLWAEIDVQPTLIGRLRSFLFKPPLLMLTVTTDAGNIQSFRIVPGMTQSGLLLSPLIETTDQFAQLPERDESIARFSISAMGRPAGAFERAIKVRLKSLNISGENEKPGGLDREAFSAMRTLRALAASAGSTPGQKKAQILPDAKALAHAPSTLSLAVPAGATKLAFGYGILDGAWAEGHITDGACFRIAAAEQTLFEECLDPKARPDDRPMKMAEVEIPAETARITFQTLPRESTDWDWTYWSAVSFK